MLLVASYPTIQGQRSLQSLTLFSFYANIIDLASDNDVLVVSCALTSETYHIIDKDVMEAIGKKGIIINVGRGRLVDEKELVRRLMEGEIGGAGLDVFENGTEVPKELFLMENVVLSPHKAVHTTESITDLKNLVIGNLEAFFANKPLISPVSPTMMGCTLNVRKCCAYICIYMLTVY